MELIFSIPLRQPLFCVILLSPIAEGEKVFVHAGQTGYAILRFNGGYYVQWTNGCYCAVLAGEEGVAWQKVTAVGARSVQ